MKHFLLFFLFVSIAFGNANAEEKTDTPTESPITGVSLNMDQDFFLPFPTLNQDRNYTMGLSLEFMGSATAKVPTGYVLDKMNNLLFQAINNKTEYEEFYSFRIANSAFTPDNLQDQNPIYDDRPYSSLLSFSNYHLYVNPSKDHFITTELTLGILGLRFSGNLQRLFHENYRQKAGGAEPHDPQGWMHQISDGGEVTAKYSISYNQIINPTSYSDITLNVDGSLGYYTNAAVGGMLRVGRINSHPLQLVTDPVGYKHKGQIPVEEGADWELYLWGNYHLRAVGYNVLLQGQFRDSNVIINNSKLNRLIHEVQLGVTGRLPCGASLTYALSGHSPEYLGPKARVHYWAGIYLTIPTFAFEKAYKTLSDLLQ